MAGEPLERGQHRAFGRTGAAAAGHEILPAAEATAIASAASAADAHRVIDARLPGRSAAETARLALGIGRDLRVAPHLLVVLVVGRLVVVGLLGFREEDRGLTIGIAARHIDFAGAGCAGAGRLDRRGGRLVRVALTIDAV